MSTQASNPVPHLVNAQGNALSKKNIPGQYANGTDPLYTFQMKQHAPLSQHAPIPSSLPQPVQKPITPTTTKRKLSITQRHKPPNLSEPTDPFVSVYLSIRKPDVNSENEHQPFRYDIMQDEQTIQVHHPNSIQSFCTNRIFHLGGVLSNTEDPSVCFSDMYNHVCAPLISDCMRGYSTALIAYGQSGSGKTYNLFSKKYGMFWRAIKDLYQSIENQSKQAKYEVSISVMEVWDKQVNDLIGNTQSKKLRQNKDIGTSIEGSDEKKCATARDAQRVLEAALKKRSIQATNLNSKASRAHLIVRLVITRRKGSDGKRVSKLDFVDLAGAMRMMNMGSSNFANVSLSTSVNDMGLSEVERDQVSERSGINVSLTTLGKVILQLSKQGEQGFVSYRDSLLTQLLKDVLGGNCKTVLLACMSDHTEYLEDSLSTLRFSERAKHIKNSPIPNEDSSPTVVVEDLKEQIFHLRGDITKYSNSVHMYKMEIEQQQQEILQARSQTEILQRLEEDFQELQKKYQFQEDQHQLNEEQHRGQLDALSQKIADIEQQKQTQMVQAQEREDNLKEQIQLLKETEKELLQANSDQASQFNQLKDSLSEATASLESAKKDYDALQQKLSQVQTELSTCQNEKENVTYELSTKIKNIELELDLVQKKSAQNSEEYEKQIQALRAEREDSLKQYIQQQKENMMYINKQAQEHQSELNSVKKRYQEEIAVLQLEHRNAVQKSEEESARELDLIKTHLTQQLQNANSDCESLRTQIESLKINHTNELNNTRAALESEINTIKEHNRKHMQDLSSNHQEELENIIQLQKKKMNSLREELTQAQASQIAEIKKTHEEDIQKLLNEMKEQKNSHDTELNNLQMNHKQEMSDINAEHEKILKENTDAFEMKITNIIAEKDDEKKKVLEDERSATASQIQTLASQHRSEIEKLEETHLIEITNLKQMHTDFVQQLQKGHSDSLQASETRHADAIAQLKSEYENKLSTLAQHHMEEIQSLQEKRDKEMEEITKQHQNKLEEERKKYEGDLSEIATNHASVLADRDAQIDALTQSVESNRKYQTWVEKHKKLILESLSEI